MSVESLSQRPIWPAGLGQGDADQSYENVAKVAFDAYDAVFPKSKDTSYLSNFEAMPELTRTWSARQKDIDNGNFPNTALENECAEKVNKYASLRVIRENTSRILRLFQTAISELKALEPDRNTLVMIDRMKASTLSQMKDRFEKIFGPESENVEQTDYENLSALGKLLKREAELQTFYVDFCARLQELGTHLEPLCRHLDSSSWLGAGLYSIAQRSTHPYLKARVDNHPVTQEFITQKTS